MPIRAENRSRYPKDWPEISRAIKERARYRCEFIEHTTGIRCWAVHGEAHPITGSKVVLTTAHLDHTPENCAPTNLMAACQRCHNRYDAATRRAGIVARKLIKT